MKKILFLITTLLVISCGEKKSASDLAYTYAQNRDYE